MSLCPVVKGLREGGGLRTCGGQVLLAPEHEYHVAFGREVRNILGDDSPALGPGGCRHLGIVSRAETDLCDVDCVVTVCLAQEQGYSRREHLVDQEGSHASSASRCCDVLRIRSVMVRFRSIRSRTSSGCSAA